MLLFETVEAGHQAKSSEQKPLAGRRTFGINVLNCRTFSNGGHRKSSPFVPDSPPQTPIHRSSFECAYPLGDSPVHSFLATGLTFSSHQDRSKRCKWTGFLPSLPWSSSPLRCYCCRCSLHLRSVWSCFGSQQRPRTVAVSSQ